MKKKDQGQDSLDESHLEADFCGLTAARNVLYLKGFGAVTGAIGMKLEMYKNGPIGCGIDATGEMDFYTGTSTYLILRIII